MREIRRHGFRHLISSYGIADMGYKLYRGVDDPKAQAWGFEHRGAFYQALYREIDRHAETHNWVPVAWNLCDEPGREQIARSAANVRDHAQAGEGLLRTTFMGATALTRNSPNRALVERLPVASLNLHDAYAIDLIHERGHDFSFYNGATRWTLGRYMRFLVKRHGLKLRLTWHFNNAAGDPYFALDCREDDYCWFNTNTRGELVPSMHYLTQVVPGLNDYRYLATLERMVEERGLGDGDPATKLLGRMLDLTAGDSRSPGAAFKGYSADRAQWVEALKRLVCLPDAR
jgi:hypothetical protein